MKPLGMATLLLVLGATGAYAQDDAKSRASIAGVVADSAGMLVPYAEVEVLGAGVRVFADETGSFRLVGLAPGEITIRVRRLGFSPRIWRLTVPGGHHTLAFNIDPAPILLTDVVVDERSEPRRAESRLASSGQPRNIHLDGFEERKQSGSGLFFDREEILRRGASTLRSFMRSVPGLRVVQLSAGRSTLRSSRGGSAGCQPRLYLDGSEFPIDMVGLEGVPMGDVEAIEVARGASEVHPIAQQPTPGCVVVYVWTRTR